MAKAKSKKKKNNQRRKERTRDATVSEEVVQEKATAKSEGAVVNRISEADEDMTAGEKLVKKAEPYFAHILLGVLSLILAWVLIKFFVSSQNETASEQWRDLSNARTQSVLSSDPTALREMADQYPNEKAGNWAMLMAADREFNRGLDMLPNDRIGGLKVIEKAAEAAEVVVNSPASAKSSLVQKRSLFLAAKTSEALGKFEVAEKYYSEIIEQAPDSELVSAAERGLVRSTSKDYAAIYDRFRNFDEVAAAEEAPGPLVPNKPELEFDIEIPKDAPAVMPEKEVEPVDEKKAFKPGEAEPADSEKPAMKEPMPEAEKVEAEKVEAEKAPVEEKSVEPVTDEPAEPSSGESPAPVEESPTPVADPAPVVDPPPATEEPPAVEK